MTILDLILIPSIALVAGDPRIGPEFLGKKEEKRPTKIVKTGGLELSVFFPEKNVAGESLTLLIIIKNQSEQDVVLYEGSTRDLHLKVHDKKGVPLALTRYGQWAIGDNAIAVYRRRVAKIIAPGDMATETINLARFFDFSVAAQYKFSLKRVLNENSKVLPVVVLEMKDVPFKVVAPKK